MTGRTGGSARLALLEHVPEMVTVSDREGGILYANPATERVSGYTPEEFVALDPFERMHAEDRLRYERAFAELLRTPGLILELEHRVRHKDGTWRWVKGTFASLFDDPEVGGLLATVRDITEAKGAEEALREGEARNRLIVEGARDYAILTLDPEGRIESWSPGAEAVFGWDAEEVVGRTPGFTFTPEDRERGVPEGELADARRDGSAPDVRWHARKDGSRAFIEGRTMALRRADGGLRGFLKIGQDLTERRRAEEALGASEERYRLAAEAAGIGRWELLAETGELAGDETWKVHHGIAPGSDLGFEDHLRAIHPGDRDRVRRGFARALGEGEGYEAEYRVALRGGPTRWVLSRGRPSSSGGSDSAPERLVGVTLDVTDRRELEAERERARAREMAARAEAAERERVSRELHDRVAHTMGVAHQSLQLHRALTGKDPARAAEKLALATEATRKALDQTRDLSAQLARRGTEETRDGLAAALDALLETHVPDGVEAELSVEGDEMAVPPPVREQAYLVMREAVRNAVEHSGCGRVRVRLELDDGELRGSVEDDGEGFDPGGDPDGGRDDREDGGPAVGVGLRSMRERAGLLDGRLEVHSEPGRGTAVEVRIPLAD